MIRVNRSEFLAKLESVQPGLSPKEIIEQSSCFVFRKGQVITYDDEVSCRCPSGLPEDFIGAVHANPLLAILRKLEEEEIEVEASGEEFLVKGKGRRAGIRLQAEILLPIKNVEKPEGWQKLDDAFGDAVGIVQQCAGKDESMWKTTCVHIAKDWLEASDRYQVIRYLVKTPIKKPCLVRRESIKDIAAMGMSQFAEGESWIHFRNANKLIFSCRRYLEEFMELDEILAVEGEPIVLPKGLAEAAEKADIFSSENQDHNNVQVELRSGKLRIRGEGVSGWYSEIRSVKYKGRELRFYIPPKLLVELTQKYNDFQITEKCLKVDGGHFQYVTCLGEPENADAERDAEGLD